MPEAHAQAPATGVPSLAERYGATRRLTEALCAPLSEADATLQSMADASPAKWHLAHTTWFFETFLLRDRAPGYRLFDERWPFLFNSYYETEGERIARPRRGMLSRPTVAGIREWRAHVDEHMEPLLADPLHAQLIELGIAHEQQHQELLLTDIKHALAQNPLGPAMWDAPAAVERAGGNPVCRISSTNLPTVEGQATQRRATLAGGTGVERRRAASVVLLAGRWDGRQGLALLHHRCCEFRDSAGECKSGQTIAQLVARVHKRRRGARIQRSREFPAVSSRRFPRRRARRQGQSVPARQARARGGRSTWFSAGG